MHRALVAAVGALALLLPAGEAPAERQGRASAPGDRAEAPQAEASPTEAEAADETPRALAAVLFLAAGGADPSLAENLTEVLVAAVASSGDFAIVGREQFGRAMGVGGEEETLRCAGEPVCLGRLGAVVGAEQIVLGAMNERSGRYVVNLSRVDVRSARLVHRVFRATSSDLGELIEAVREGAQELMQPPPAAARISVNVEQATVLVDGEPVTPDPDGVVRGLEPGRHTLLVSREGYSDARQEFEATRGDTAELSVSLSPIVTVVERGTPWYRRWWVWTLVGVAVAGAATGVAVPLTMSQREPPRGTLDTIDFPQ